MLISGFYEGDFAGAGFKIDVGVGGGVCDLKYCSSELVSMFIWRLDMFPEPFTLITRGVAFALGRKANFELALKEWSKNE